jgi:hypothetical protein
MDKKDDWRLDKIELEFKRPGYGDDGPGKYEGRIRFENGQWERFSFKIQPDMAERYIATLSEDIVKAASDLGRRVAASIMPENMNEADHG